MKLKILLYILAIVILASATSAMTCQDAGTLVCGSSPDSTLGYGAVDICETCYPCGVSDGVCPEDFYDSSASIQGSCAHCPDLDCEANLHVTVFDEWGSKYNGADVEVHYDTSIVEPSGTTNSSGEILFQDIPSGHVNVIVSDDVNEMIAISQEANLTRGETTNLIFTNLSQAACQADCTRGDGFCHESCFNQGACTISGPLFNFTQADVAIACDIKQNGTSAPLSQIGNHIYRAQCCQGPVIESVRPKININDYQDETEERITGLVNHVQGALYNSEKIFVISTYWQYEE